MSAVLDTTDVHLGHWINWSLGSVRGSTITLTRRDGALLTAFLALFVSFAGSRIWRIVAFTIHLSLARQAPQDGVVHQRQVILRNSYTPFGAAMDLVRVAWAWRKAKSSIYRHVLPLAITSLLVGLAFSVAGVFSAQISSSVGSEVLLAGSHCARLASPKSTADLQNILQPYFSALQQTAGQRSQECYTSNASTANCPIFIKASLPLNIDEDAPCPFDDSICQKKTGNLLVDTGYLNSHDDFGLNQPPEKRIAYRVKTECAPLVLDGHTRVVDRPQLRVEVTDPSEYTDDSQWVQLLYGNNTYSKFDAGLETPINFTYQYPIKNLDNRLVVADGSDKDFTVLAMIAQANTSNLDGVDFAPIPELHRDDADTAMFYLSGNTVFFGGPTDDPWYSAHQGPFETPWGADPNDGNFSYWQSDNPVNVVSCALSSMWCNPNVDPSEGCSPFMSYRQILANLQANDTEFLAPWLDETQRSFFSNFILIADSFNFEMVHIIATQGVAALAGHRGYSNIGQAQLPSNQWQIDMEYLVSTQLATYQRAFVEYANGPTWPGLESYLIPPQTDIEQQFCHSQKIRSANFTSFSTLGLVLSFVIGGLFIVVSYLLEPVLPFAQRRGHWHNFRLTEWWMNDTLQLQSVVHEELGVGTWTREIGLVPTAEPGELLATIDLSDPTHPRYKAPRLSWSEGDDEEKMGVVRKERVDTDLSTQANAKEIIEADSESGGDSPISTVCMSEHPKDEEKGSPTEG